MNTKEIAMINILIQMSHLPLGNGKAGGRVAKLSVDGAAEPK